MDRKLGPMVIVPSQMADQLAAGLSRFGKGDGIGGQNGGYGAGFGVGRGLEGEDDLKIGQNGPKMGPIQGICWGLEI